MITKEQIPHQTPNHPHSHPPETNSVDGKGRGHVRQVKRHTERRLAFMVMSIDPLCDDSRNVPLLLGLRGSERRRPQPHPPTHPSVYSIDFVLAVSWSVGDLTHTDYFYGRPGD